MEYYQVTERHCTIAEDGSDRYVTTPFLLVCRDVKAAEEAARDYIYPLLNDPTLEEITKPNISAVLAVDGSLTKQGAIDITISKFYKAKVRVVRYKNNGAGEYKSVTIFITASDIDMALRNIRESFKPSEWIENVADEVLVIDSVSLSAVEGYIEPTEA